MSNNVVPFGKYKNRPIEDLLADSNYIEWLVGQPWIQEKYPTVYNIIHSAGGEPAETPEHNALQAQFLDDDFIFGIFTRIKKRRINSVKKEFEYNNWDVYLHIDLIDWGLSKPKGEALICLKDERIKRCEELGDNDNWLLNCRKEELEEVTKLMEEKHCYYSFGRCSSDILPFSIGPAYERYIQTWDIFVEIKPQVGDDYPAILRQMKRNRQGSPSACHFILYTKSISTKYLREDQVIQIFNQSGFQVYVDRR